jgi:hypothetical protein
MTGATITADGDVAADFVGPKKDSPTLVFRASAGEGGVATCF